MTELSPSARRVEQALTDRGMPGRVRELAASTRTATEAAAAIGCDVAQIAKSLIFRCSNDGRPVLAMASGRNRIDERRLSAIIGQPLGRADAEFVRQQTGFAIGGVPPLGHPQPIETVIDRDLLGLDPLWAAAGTPLAVFRLTAQELIGLTEGRIADVAVR